MTQTEMGKRANIDRRTISSYERGGNFPRKDNLNKVAEVLNVTTGYLLGNEVDTEEVVLQIDKEILKMINDLVKGTAVT